ncbi:MAG TPA: glycosyltransferase family 2 protein [Armatimonadota bacterium]|nr:glycosyltransferase family 2 protein [Armatimonadota bacterium]
MNAAGARVPDISLVIPAYNRADLLERCLESVRGSEGVEWEATVVDNASPEDLSAVRERYPEMRWLRLERNIGYAAANNLGLRDARGRHRCYLNSDAELFPDTLVALVAYLDGHPEVGAVTPKNVGPDGLPQPICTPEHTLQMAWLRDSGFHLLFPNGPPFRDWLLPHFDWDKEQEVATCQTTCLVIRGEAYQSVGEMDPSLFLFYNDVDYCRRLREGGWKLVYLPHPPVLHHGSASVETAPWKERQLWRDRYRYFAKWYGLRGTAGVRFSCLHRGLTRLLAQVVTGRMGALRGVGAQSVALYRALGSEGDGM